MAKSLFICKDNLVVSIKTSYNSWSNIDIESSLIDKFYFCDYEDITIISNNNLCLKKILPNIKKKTKLSLSYSNIDDSVIPELSNELFKLFGNVNILHICIYKNGAVLNIENLIKYTNISILQFSSFSAKIYCDPWYINNSTLCHFMVNVWPIIEYNVVNEESVDRCLSINNNNIKSARK